MKPRKFSIINDNDSKKIAAIIIFILAFLAFIWEIFSAFHTPEQRNTEDKPLILRNNLETIRSNSALFTTAVFGDYVPANLSEADIKQSTLNVQVVGIMFAAKENESQVILRVGGGKEDYFVVGDILPGGAIIKRISPEGVVVLHDGALESLSLPKNELIFEVPAKPLIKQGRGFNSPI
ncbi:MAG: general secretion pathway protein GspC [Tatlockia sp.]|nr:general secretion pathway protein GspC [Tatlockia sp.]